jgi:hypothetical protein
MQEEKKFMPKKRELLLSLLVFIFATILLFWPVFIRGMTLFPGSYLVAWFEPYKSDSLKDGKILIQHKPVADDVFRHIYPFKLLAVDSIKHFQLPLWNPYNGAGMPLLATVNSGLIDPFNLLFLFLPHLFAWNLYLFLQFLLIAFFTYLYIKKIGLSTPAAIFSAFVFTLSGVVVARVTLGAYGAGIAMLPLLLFVIETYEQNPKTRLLFIIPFAIFTVITATHPQISLYILGFAVIYLLVKEFSVNATIKKKCKRITLPLVFICIGVLLTSIQILPTIELLHYANFSTESSAYIEKFLVPFWHLVSIGIPNYFGNISTYNFWGKSDYIETVAAVGLVPCFFAYFALFFDKKRDIPPVLKKIYTIGLITTFLLAVDSPISRGMLSLPIPILSTDPPSRIFLLTTFFLAILSGFGFELFHKQKYSLIKLIKYSLPFLATILLIAGGTVALNKWMKCIDAISTCYRVALRNTLLEIAVFALGFIVCLIYVFWKHKKGQIILPYLLIGTVFAIGFYNAEKFLPFSPTDTVLPHTQLLNKINDLKKDGRIFGFGGANITTDLATYFQFYDPQYYHPLYIKRYGELTAFANYNDIKNEHVFRSDAIIRNDVSLSPQEMQRRNRVLSLLSVQYLIFNKDERPATQSAIWSNNNRYIQKNIRALPHAFIVDKQQIQTDKQQILTTLFSPAFNPISQVVLEKDPKLLSAPKNLQSATHILQYKENNIQIQTQTNKAAILVLLDNYYPGWKASIDGAPTEIYRADYTFRAVKIPQGNHKVDFTYQPFPAILGLTISLSTLGLILLGFILYPTVLKLLKITSR